MKDSLKWIGGGVFGVALALGGVAGLGYAAGIQLGGSATAPAPQAPTVIEHEALAPVPSPLDREELVTTHTPTLIPPAVAPAPVVQDDAPIRVRRLIIATDIVDHEPVGAAETFRIGAQDRIYAFVDAVNESDSQIDLRVTFEPEDGESTGHVALHVPAHMRRFRTWAYSRNIARPGRWEAVVRAPDGSVVARQEFEVTR